MRRLQVIARNATHSSMSLKVLQVIATVHRREHTPVLMNATFLFQRVIWLYGNVSISHFVGYNCTAD